MTKLKPNNTTSLLVELIEWKLYFLLLQAKTNYSPEEIIIAFTSELVGTDEGSPEGIAPDMSSLTLNHSLLPPFKITNTNKFQKIDYY